jgi:hypothetical protein
MNERNKNITSREREEEEEEEENFPIVKPLAFPQLLLSISICIY